MARGDSSSASDLSTPTMSLVEFIVFTAALASITALSIDIILPALSGIDASLQFAHDNQRQYVVLAYSGGFAAAQILVGPLSDSFGRRIVLFSGFGLFVIASLICAFAPNLDTLLAGRALQGVASAAPRVISIAVVRDCFKGRDMAHVMSFVTMAFMFMPVTAPAMGQGLLFVSSWRGLFIALAAVGALLFVWGYFRLNETLPPGRRTSFSVEGIGRNMKLVLTNRKAMTYTLATGFVFGALMSYVATSEQILVGIYDLGPWFPVAFGAAAASMAVSAFLNGGLVRRHGMRRLSRMAVIAMCVGSALMILLGAPERPHLLVFCGYVAFYMFCLGFVAPNFNALALEDLGKSAGAAASVIGCYSSAAAVLFALIIAGAYDGTVRPFFIGVSVMATLTLLTIFGLDRKASRSE